MLAKVGLLVAALGVAALILQWEVCRRLEQVMRFFYIHSNLKNYIIIKENCILAVKNHGLYIKSV